MHEHLNTTLLLRYIRVKRLNQTYFIQTTPQTKIQSVKDEISKALTNNNNSNEDTIPNDQMRIYHLPQSKSKSLQDSKGSSTASTGATTASSLLKEETTVGQHKITNDAVLYVVFRKEGCEDEDEGGEGLNDELWEGIQIVEVEE